MARATPHSLLWQALKSLDPQRVVHVEGESRKIGRLRVPEALIQTMREQAQCVNVELDDAARVQLLLQEYGHFAADPEAFCGLLDGLVTLRGREAVAAWQQQARDGQWREVFGELMRQHYDPLYERSLRASYPRLAEAQRLQLTDAEPGTLRDAAKGLLP